jgi:hypothetical protein
LAAFGFTVGLQKGLDDLQVVLCWAVGVVQGISEGVQAGIDDEIRG